MIGRGMELGAIIGGLTYVGYLGDEHYGTGPWLTLTGAVLATVGGSYNLVKEVLFPPRVGRSARGSFPEKREDSRDGSRPDGEHH